MIFINKEINEYVKSHSSVEPELLSKLRRETEIKFINPIMLSSESQGILLSLISKIKKPKNILEIGTYTGYSTLCMAEGLENDGIIYTIDKNEELLDIQNKYFKLSKYRKNIKQFTGKALEIIPLIKSSFDMVFLDADKENYSNYLKLVSPLMEENGILLTDNVLWHGKILENSSSQDVTTKLIDKFNKDLARDESFQTIMLPIRDGISISVKL